MFSASFYIRDHAQFLWKILFIYFGCAGLSCCVKIFSNCVAWTPEHWLSSCTPAVRHVASSQASDQSHVLCIGKWTPNHWATREAPVYLVVFLFTTWGVYCFYLHFLRTSTVSSLRIFKTVFTSCSTLKIIFNKNLKNSD